MRLNCSLVVVHLKKESNRDFGDLGSLEKPSNMKYLAYTRLNYLETSLGILRRTFCISHSFLSATKEFFCNQIDSYRYVLCLSKLV